jgi:hypothetical protein
MTPFEQRLIRLQFLARVARKESRHLQTTDQRLFVIDFDAARARSLDSDADLAERVEAFVSRFGRLQDTLGDKLLPALLSALGEKVGAQLDNLDVAERLGYIESSESWFAVRELRNQMVHEYIEDPEILASALRSGHDFVSVLVTVTDTLTGEIERRGWLS